MPTDKHCYGDLVQAITADLLRSSTKIGFPVKRITRGDIELDDIVIGVFGETGSGKSTFINALADNGSGQRYMESSPDSHTIIDCVQISVPSIPTKVVFVEVPGFGDEGESDARTLSLFFSWLEFLYTKGKQISGVLFLDPITGVDTKRTSMSRSLKILQKMYGHLQRDRVILITSKWNQIPLIQRGHAQQLERALFKTSWRSFLDGDDPSLTARFDSGSKRLAFQHATEILVMLIGHMRHTGGIEFLLQQQGIDDGMPLYWTDAGKLAFTMAEVEKYRDHVHGLPSPHPIANATVVGLRTSLDVTLKDIRDDDIIIGIFGETGTGKSTFAQALSHGGESRITVGHNTPGTSQVTCVRIWMAEIESNVVIVDTPGFNNPLVSDAETLQVLATWLVDLYRSGRRLHGALYLHRITDVRIDSGAQHSLSIFLSLYGRSGYDHLTLVTTMWDNVPRSELYMAKERERDLLSSNGYRVIGGAEGESTRRFNSSTQERAYIDARDIVVDLTRRTNDTIKLRIQEQIVDRNLPLRDTDAGSLAFEPEIETDDDRDPTLPFHLDSDDEESTSTVDTHDGSESSRRPAEKVTLDTLTNRDIVVGVFGATGVGKTTFIDALAKGQATWLTIGDSLDAGTRDIGCVRIHFPEMNVCAVLVDTPGFDDESRTDGDILVVITTWLQALRKAGYLLSGAIYINQITSVRIDSGTQRAMHIFGRMFGDEENDRITLVTSKWNDINRDDMNHLRIAESREKDLFTDAWAIFLNNSKPASTARFEYDLERGNTANGSAMRILMELLKRVRNRGGIMLRVQRQMLDEHLPLEKTDAGKVAFEEPQDDDALVEDIDLDDLDDDDVVICIFGETGAGKTEFITALAGEYTPGLRVGHDLEAATDGVCCIRFRIPHLGKNVVLVDTPGFNQARQSDGAILEIVATWLARSHADRGKLDGVLFLQSVHVPASSPGADKTLKIFRKMYGDTNGYQHTTFVTTMWNEISRYDQNAWKAAEEREMSLAAAWSPYLNGQLPARMQRFDSSTSQSAYDHALKIITPILEGHGKWPPLTMRIQEEMVNKGIHLLKTEAGKAALTPTTPRWNPFK